MMPTQTGKQELQSSHLGTSEEMGQSYDRLSGREIGEKETNICHVATVCQVHSVYFVPYSFLGALHIRTHNPSPADPKSKKH